ncbi:MAG: hypothetical protein U9Q63_03600 [Patescibacteria group bacterium]|nr:hypothetical protein [Patescibacteria group bacterium]
MLNISEKSPLYQPNISQKERHAIQTYNYKVIQEGIARYSLQPGKREVFLRKLNINGRLTNEATLTIFYNQAHTLLTYIKHPNHDDMICRREVYATKNSMIDWAKSEFPFWIIDQSMLNTTSGFEGNGFGKSLLVASESLMPTWVKDLKNPPNCVIARHFDNSRGAEQSVKDQAGYRTGWTSQILSELGYKKGSLSLLNYYFGEDRTSNLGTPEKNWIKVFR